MNREWRKKSVKIFLILFVLTTLIIIFSSVFASNITVEQAVELNNLSVGETVLAGDSIEHSDYQPRFSLLAHPQFLLHEFTSLDIFGFVQSLSTGSVSFDYTSVAGDSITPTGHSSAEGPGFLDVKDGKLIIKDCTKPVSGYLYQETYLVKNKTGISVYEHGKYSHTVPVDQIKNQNWAGPNFNITTVRDWYNSADNNYGSMFPLDMGVGNIIDGRKNLSSDEIKEFFGEDTYQYLLHYPSGDGVCLYIPPNYKQSAGEEFTTTLGDHSEYGNNLRDFNANQFCKAWNNTIIPPKTSVCGKEGFSFEVAADNESSSGGASHGVCPPARTLRSACLAEGFDLPVGMSSDENAVNYGYNPSTGIFVYNNGDYPVKVVMWSTGSGVSMVIHCKFIKYTPTASK